MAKYKCIDIDRIETADDLLKWARTVNSNLQSAAICDLQDVYAHSQTETIDRLFIECKGDRALIICSVRNAMAFEEVERLLKVLAQHKVKAMMEAEYAEFDKRLVELVKRERIFEECKKPIHKKIHELTANTQWLELNLDRARKDEAVAMERTRHWESLYREAQEKAAKYDNIKSLLA
jgi:hypothetical protein